MLNGSNPLFQSFFEASPESLLMVDGAGNCVDANPSACGLLGRSRLSFQQMNWLEMISDRVSPSNGNGLQSRQGEFHWPTLDEEGQILAYSITPTIAPNLHLWLLRDVSDRHRQAAELAELRQQLVQNPNNGNIPEDPDPAQAIPLSSLLHRLLESLPVCIAYVDRDRRYRYVNPNYCDWLDLTAADIQGQRLIDILGAESYPMIQPYVERVLAGESVTYDLHLAYGSRSPRYMRGILVPDIEEPNHVQGYFALIVDLSDRHQMELALKASQQKYQTLFEILPVGVSITDAQGQILEVNPMSEEILGITSQDHTQRTFDESSWQILRPDLSPMPPEEYASVRALRENRTISGVEKRVVRPDGELRWLSVSAAPIPLDDYGVAIAYIDITEQKQIESDLRRSEEQRKLATDFSKTGCWELDLATGKAIWNANQFQLMGLSPIEAISHYHTWRDRVHPDDLALAETAFQQALDQKIPLDVEYRVVHPDGTERWMLTRGRGMYDAAGSPQKMVGVMLDITDRKQATLSLQDQTQRERAFNEVVQAIRSSLDLDTIFSIATVEIADLLQGEVSIVQYCPDQQCWRHLVVSSQDEQGYAEKLAIDIPDADNPFASQLKQFQVVKIDNTETVDDPINRELARAFPGAWLLVPISVDGRIWGSLTLARPYQHTPWQLEYVELAQRVADQLAIAIHQSTLYQRLQTSYEQYALVLQSIGEGIWDRNLMTHHLHVSSRYWEILGYDPQHPPRITVETELQRVHPSDRPRLQAIFQQHLESGQRYKAEVQVQHQQGHYIWLRLRGQVIHDEQQQPIRFLGTIEDISDRKQTEAALVQSEAKNRAILAAMPDLLFRVGTDGRYRELVSDTSGIDCCILGQDPAGLAMTEVMPPELAQQQQDYLQRTLETGQLQIYEQQRVVGESVRHEEVRICQSGADEVLFMIRDISDRKRLEHDLRDSRNHLASILNNSFACIVSFQLFPDHTWVYDYYSQSSETIYGYSPQEMQHNVDLWRSRVVPEDFEQIIIPALQQVVEGQTQANLEYRFRHRDGSLRWIREVSTAHWQNDKGCWQITTVASDISDRKAIEEALRQSNAHYKSLAEAMPQCLYRKDRQGRLTYVNPSALRWTGGSESDLLGKTVYDFYPQDLAVKYDKDDRWVLETGEILDTVEEHQLPHLDKRLYVQIVKSPVRDGHGEIVGTQGIFWDVTERIALEAALKESEARLSFVLNSSAAAILYAQVFRDRTYHYDYCSQGCETIFGYTAEELMADPHLWWSRVHPEDINTYVFPAFESVFAEQTQQFEYRFQTKDETWRWLMVTVTSHWDAALQSWHVTNVHTDISDRKAAEKALQNSETRFRQLAENVREGFYVIDVDSCQYAYVNPAYSTILGLSGSSNLTGMSHWLDRIHPSDRPRIEASLERERQGQTFSEAYRFYHPDGSLHWLQSKAFPIFNDQGQIARVVGTVEDITDRKLADEALRQREELLNIFFSQALDGCFFMMLDEPIEWNESIDKDAILDYAFAHQRMTRINEAMLSQYGTTADQFLGLTPNDLFAHNISHGRAVWREFFDAGHLHVETQEQKLDGTPIVVEGDYVCIYDDQGRITGHFGIQRDVSDRKAAETALRQREEEFRALAENSPDCILRCDRQFRFLYVNPMVATITGIPIDQFLGYTSQELGFPEDLVTLWHQAMERAFATKEEQTLQYTLPQELGATTSLSRIVPEFEPDGTVTSVLISARDITELKQAQTELVLQAQREQLLNTITQHIRRSLDLHEILQTAVDETRDLLQADRVLIYHFNEDWSGDMIAESVIPPWISVLNTTLRDPCFANQWVDEYRHGKVNCIQDLATADVESCYIELLEQFQIRAALAVPITDGKKLWGLFCIHHCATTHNWQAWEVELLQRLADQLAIAIQQSELHQQLQQWADTLEQQVQDRTAEIQQALELEATLKRITDRVRDSLDEDQILETVVQELGQVLHLECCDTGIYNADLTSSTIAHEFNRSGISARGCTFEIANATHSEIYPFLFQGISLQFCDLVPCSIRANESQLSVMACPIQDDQSMLGDMWLMKANCEIFTPLEVRLVQQVANQCAIALRQARLFESAQEQVVELERLHHLKDDFLSTVSHELRTPMSSIQMATQLVEIQLQQANLLDNESNQPLHQYFQILKDECQREIILINNLLDLTRIEANSDPLMTTTMKLHPWVSHLLEPFASWTSQQQQTLEINIPEFLSLCTDLSYLERILSELLHNACKYTPPGETISISASEQSTRIEMVISNSGTEIPAVECDRIFDKFYRIPNNDPWKHGGTGLGLALVKGFTERLGGTIQVESYNNQVIFILSFPQL